MNERVQYGKCGCYNVLNFGAKVDPANQRHHTVVVDVKTLAEKLILNKKVFSDLFSVFLQTLTGHLVGFFAHDKEDRVEHVDVLAYEVCVNKVLNGGSGRQW